MKGNLSYGDQICILKRPRCLQCSERIRRSKYGSKGLIREAPEGYRHTYTQAPSHMVVAEIPPTGTEPAWGFSLRRTVCLWPGVLPRRKLVSSCTWVRFLYAASSDSSTDSTQMLSGSWLAASLPLTTPGTFSPSPSSFSLDSQRPAFVKGLVLPYHHTVTVRAVQQLNIQDTEASGLSC